MPKKFDIPDLFIGPLPNESYAQVRRELKLFPQDRTAELIARAIYGQKMARLSLSETEQKLEYKRIDTTTGVLSKDEWLERTEAKLIGFDLGRRADDRNNSAILFQFDVEEFKDINDTLGWSEGDRCLKAVGNFIKSIARLENGDLVGRIGGDEFALFVPYNNQETEEESVFESLEARIRDRLIEKFPGLPYLRWNHAFYDSGDTAETLVEKANVKGNEDIKTRTRSHRQTQTDYIQSIQKARKASLSK